jgi:PAS domain S-box-containing protein
MAGRSKENDKDGGRRKLRADAEKIARKKAPDIPENLRDLSPAAVRKLLHDLQVYQIELEMQNEQLRQAQERLEESQAQYFELYDVAPVGYFSISDKGLILQANLTGANLLGAVPGDLRAQRFNHFIFKEDQDVYYLHRKQLFETSAPQVCEIRMLRRDGALFWARMEATLAQDGKRGKPVCRAAMSDITGRKRAEDTLRESEARFRKISALTNDISYSCLTNKEGDLAIEWMAGATEQITGYTIDEIKAQSCWRFLVVEEDIPLFEEHVTGLLPGQSASCQLRIRRKDGTIRWLDSNAECVAETEADGRLILYAGLVDITERKQMEEALRESEERYRTILEQMYDVYYEVDLAGNFTFLNEATCRKLGYSHEEMIGKSYRFTVPKDDIDRLFAASKAVFNSGEPNKCYPHSILRKDGSIVLAESYIGLRRNEHGKIIGFRTVSRDVTARKQAEAALHDSEEKYRVVVENALEAILIAIDGMIIFTNNRTAVLTGYAQEELTSRPFTEFIHPDDRDMVIDRHLRRMKGEDFPNIYSFRIIAKAGNIKWVELSAVLITWEGRPATLNFLTDITDRRRLEEERQRVDKLESVGVLAGGIAHDFNNILTAILGNISLAGMEAAPGSDLQNSLEQAEKASLRAKALTKQLLTFSKGGAPVTELASLAELLKETARFALRGSRVKCRFSIPAGLWHAEIDAGQVSQVIHNLVINAQQSMPTGGSIEISAENIALSEMQSLGKGLPLKSGNYIRMAVADHGTGIPKDHLEKIFDPFFTTKQKGNGLGLATSFSIARQHGGHISVESELGAGSTFYLYLPASTQAVTPKQEKRDKKEAIKPAGKARILVMDDEQDVREIAGRMLGNIGYQDIEFAVDGAEAIKLYKAAMETGNPFTVAILDLTIAGGMGGEETIKKLLKIDLGVKAIVSSGYVDDSVIAKYRDYGFSGVVAKPYTIAELRKAVQDVIG